MKASYQILFVWGLLLPISAQTIDTPKEDRIISDEVQNAIDEFNRLKSEGKKQKEVGVALPRPAVVEVMDKTLADPANEAAKEQAVLVTGELTEEPASAQVDESEETPAPEPSAEEVTESEPPAPPVESKDYGLEIRVESIRKGTGKLDPTKINLRASFPAKPLANPPPGWLLEKSKDAPAITREVEIQPGTVISLDIKPHILIPDAAGPSVFAVNEPGFDPLEGYHQQQTVSAILAKSVLQLDEDAKQLGSALSELHRVLASLPQPEPKALPAAEVE